MLFDPGCPNCGCGGGGNPDDCTKGVYLVTSAEYPSPRSGVTIKLYSYYMVYLGEGITDGFSFASILVPHGNGPFDRRPFYAVTSDFPDRRSLVSGCNLESIRDWLGSPYP